jgi:hypothetical protein
MLSVIILLVLLLAFWAYVRWDAKRLRDVPAMPVARAKMEKAHASAGVVAWQIYLGLGLLSALLAFMEWQAPSVPPFTGRWSWVKGAMLEAFGPGGPFSCYVALAVGATCAGLTLLWKAKR